MTARVVVAFALAVVKAIAQQPFPLVEIDEVGHLDSIDDERKSADLGFARVYPDGSEVLRIEGFDNEGLPWRMWMPRVSEVGASTRVFRADFDGNGRMDLLFSALWMGNGRCIQGGTVTTLLFEVNGRPVPWRIQTHGLTNDGSTPVTLLDLDANGQAEFVANGCVHSSSDDYRMGVDRRLTGVYEARDARWFPIRPDSLDRYLDVVQRRFDDSRPGSIRWMPPGDEPWPDPLPVLGGERTIRATGLLGGVIGCVGSYDNDRDCDLAAKEMRMRYSDGEVRGVWPAVIIDSAEGRAIHTTDTQSLIERIIHAGVPVRLLGPDSLWVQGQLPDDPVSLVVRLAITSVQSNPIELVDKPEISTTRLRGILFSRAGRCFVLQWPIRQKPLVQPLPDCQELGPLQPAASRGDRAWTHEGDFAGRSLSTTERSVSTISWFGGVLAPEHRVEFRPVPRKPGDIVGAELFGRDWLVHWTNGTDSWLVLHSRAGQPTSPAIKLGFDGELFHVDLARGFVFLRWEDGVPVELSLVKAALEWVRQE